MALWLRLAAAALPLAASGCAPDGNGGDPPPGPLPILIQDRVVGCDPRQALDVRTAAVTRHLHEGLLRYDPDSLQRGEVLLVPALAEMPVVDPDGRRFIFALRDGWHFHDDACFPARRGREVFAADVVFALERWLGPGTPAPAWRALQAVRGASAFHAGLVAHAAGLSAPDPRTVVIELERRDPYLLNALAGPAGWVVAPEAVERYGDDLASHPVGIGPYRLAQLDPAFGLTLVPHSGYGGRGPHAERLPRNAGLLFFYGHPTDALLGAWRYALVYANAGTFDALGARVAGRGYRVTRCPKLNTIFYSFRAGADAPWSADRRLRQAISLLMRRPEPGHPAAIAADQLLPPALRGPAGLADAAADAFGEPARTDPPRGLEMLASLRAAGVTVPDRLRLAVDPQEHSDGRVLAARLAPAGIAVEVHERGAFPPGWNPDLVRDGWIADVPDPRDFYQLFWSSSASWTGALRDPDYDRIFESALAASGSELARCCQQLERILRRELPLLPIRHELAEVAAAENVDGAGHALNPLMRPALELVRFAGGE